MESSQVILMFNNKDLLDWRMTVRFNKVPGQGQDPPTNLSRLPDGLRSVGMGLGQDGMPLLDVRANLPSPGDNQGQADNMAGSTNNMGGGGGGGGGGLGGGNNMMGGSVQGNNATSVGTAALQAALVSFSCLDI